MRLHILTPEERAAAREAGVTPYDHSRAKARARSAHDKGTYTKGRVRYEAAHPNGPHYLGLSLRERTTWELAAHGDPKAKRPKS